jgi:hypothetical protein
LLISVYIRSPPQPRNAIIYANVTAYVSSHCVISCIRRLILNTLSLIYTFVSTEI